MAKRITSTVRTSSQTDRRSLSIGLRLSIGSAMFAPPSATSIPKGQSVIRDWLRAKHDDWSRRRRLPCARLWLSSRLSRTAASPTATSTAATSKDRLTSFRNVESVARSLRFGSACGARNPALANHEGQRRSGKDGERGGASIEPRRPTRPGSTGAAKAPQKIHCRSPQWHDCP